MRGEDGPLRGCLCVGVSGPLGGASSPPASQLCSWWSWANLPLPDLLDGEASACPSPSHVSGHRPPQSGRDPMPRFGVVTKLGRAEAAESRNAADAFAAGEARQPGHSAGRRGLGGGTHRAPAPSSGPLEPCKAGVSVFHLGPWADALKLEKLLLQLLKLSWTKQLPTGPPPSERGSWAPRVGRLAWPDGDWPALGRRLRQRQPSGAAMASAGCGAGASCPCLSA